MSENLDLVRSIFGAWERGDHGSSEWAHPEIEYIWADGLSRGRWKGLEAMAGALGGHGSGRGGISAQRRTATACSMTSACWSSTASAGAARQMTVGVGDLMTKGASVWSIKGERVTRLVLYWDRDRALADLGAEE
jgi:ketosteroid isomerase-like protein